MLDARVLFCRFRGAVAQLVERYIRIVEARGSNPLSSTTTSTNCAERWREALQFAHARRLIREVPLNDLPESHTVATRPKVRQLMNDHRLKAGGWCHHQAPRE